VDLVEVKADVFDPLLVVLGGDSVLGHVDGQSGAGHVVEDAAEALRMPHPPHLRDAFVGLWRADEPATGPKRSGMHCDARVVLNTDEVV
jgi:hypothetical protein